MPDQPFPMNAESLPALIQQTMALFDDLYQDRIGGASVGDVFSIGSDDVLSLELKAAGGIKKVSGELAAELSITGGLTTASDGLAIKCKSGGGASVDANGLSVSGATVNNFQTMNCPAGTDPVASISTDTLNFTVTYGLTITGNSGTKTIAFSVKRQAHVADVTAQTQDALTDSTGGTPATTLAAIGIAITDPADAPASADALRDDLVTNTIPSIEASLTSIRNSVASLAAQLAKVKTDVSNDKTKINAVLAALETAEILAAS
jgi:hypothetical protein